MKKQKDFVIPFRGLSAGTHKYLFIIDKTFFDGFEYFESESGAIDVELELLKESSLLDLQFHLKGKMDLRCDRCLGDYQEIVEGNFRMVIKFGDEYAEESDEVIVLPLTENTIDLRQYIFEFVNLLLPIKRVHKEKKDCDPDMINKLQTHEEQENDPRWDALKNISLE